LALHNQRSTTEKVAMTMIAMIMTPQFVRKSIMIGHMLLHRDVYSQRLEAFSSVEGYFWKEARPPMTSVEV
jgi:hypothetical protein